MKNAKYVIGIIFTLSLIAFFTRKYWLPNRISCKNKFLFIGDSLTAFQESYADQLMNSCQNTSYKKIAKVGEKTDWMLSELHKELAQGNKYDIIVIWGGVNDIYSQSDINSAKYNLNSLYKLVKNNGSKIVALTILPTNTYKNSNPERIRLTNGLNDWIKSNKYIDFVIDVNSILNDGNQGTKKEYLQNDTLHLNAKGHQAIAEKLSKKIS